MIADRTFESTSSARNAVTKENHEKTCIISSLYHTHLNKTVVKATFCAFTSRPYCNFETISRTLVNQSISASPSHSPTAFATAFNTKVVFVSFTFPIGLEDDPSQSVATNNASRNLALRPAISNVPLGQNAKTSLLRSIRGKRWDEGHRSRRAMIVSIWAAVSRPGGWEGVGEVVTMVR